MRRLVPIALLFLLCMAFVAGCDVPTPPPELPTATPGSENPESLLARNALTPVQPTPERGFTPLAVPPGHVYFVRGGTLWRISPDGSGLARLSDKPLSNPPQPSPDGSMVAFTSGDGLFVMPSSGGAALEVAQGALADGQRLGWSADGTLVGYITYDAAMPGSDDAWAVSAKGGNPLLLTTMSEALGRGPRYERSVQWSPDVKWVLIGEVNNPMRLLRWPLSSGQPGDVSDIPGGEPDWSPDSRTLVYAETLSGALSIYYVIAAGATPFRNEQQFVGTRLGEYAQGPGPLWSPASSGSDTDLIAYRSRSQQGEPRVAISQRYGKELEPLPGLTNNPSWSPSGDRLVVETGYLQNDPLGPKWVPDGLAIARINLDGPQKITQLLKDAKWPVWGK
jgi:Tol biopolymer transport system component